MARRCVTGFLLLLTTLALFCGCALRKSSDINSYNQYGTTGPQKIGVVLSAPEKADSDLEAAITASVNKVAPGFGAESRTLKPGDLVNDQESLRYLAENGYDLIISIGQFMVRDVSKAAGEFPEVKFAVFNGELDLPNVTSIKFNAEETAFLAGVEAALLTKSNLVGFVGGVKSSDGEMEKGFIEGVQYINLATDKNVKINVNYAGETAAAAKDPAQGYALANNLYWSGCDVVFSGAGKLGSGSAKAAGENKKIVIVNDPTLLTMMPWNVYGVVVNKPDVVVSDLLKKTLGGKFVGGFNVYGVAEGAVDLITGQLVPPEITSQIIDIKNRLKNGQIKPYRVKIRNDMVNQLRQMPVDWGKPTGNAGVSSSATNGVQ